MPEWDAPAISARILYWGVEGAGTTANLRAVHAKLRPDHRGDLRHVPTRIDPSVSYEVLPIELGDIGGVRTQIHIAAVPPQPEQAPTRKHLLDQVHGVVFVIDSQRDRIDDNVESFEELRAGLRAYGRNLEDVPLVIQYNKRDLADPYALDELHRKLAVQGAAVFEAVATEGTGVLQTLSTISKRVIRALRGREEEAPAPPAAAALQEAAPPPTPEPTATQRMEQAILAEMTHPESRRIEETVQNAEDLLDEPWDSVSARDLSLPEIGSAAELSIVSVGEAARCGDRSLRIPLVLGDIAGRTTELVLTLTLDPRVEDEGS